MDTNPGAPAFNSPDRPLTDWRNPGEIIIVLVEGGVPDAMFHAVPPAADFLRGFLLRAAYSSASPFRRIAQ